MAVVPSSINMCIIINIMYSIIRNIAAALKVFSLSHLDSGYALTDKDHF